MKRHLRKARAWVCYHAYLWWPGRWLHSRPALAILPYAGDWAYQDDARRAGYDPWSGAVFTAEQETEGARIAHAEIKAALDKAETT